MAWTHKIICDASTLSYWQGQSVFSDTSLAVATGTPGVSKCTITWTRSTPAGTREDLCTINLHMAVVVTSTTVTQLNSSQKADAETDINTCLTSVANLQSNQFSTAEIVWHDLLFSEAKYGPADRRTVSVITGAAASARMPDQDSATVTFRTASRTHWGRVYVPGLERGAFDTTYARINNTAVDNLALFFRTLQNNLVANTASTEIVVFSKQYLAALTVSELVVDNVPDVVRRRRPKQSSYRKSYTS